MELPWGIGRETFAIIETDGQEWLCYKERRRGGPRRHCKRKSETGPGLLALLGGFLFCLLGFLCHEALLLTLVVCCSGAESVPRAFPPIDTRIRVEEASVKKIPPGRRKDRGKEASHGVTWNRKRRPPQKAAATGPPARLADFSAWVRQRCRRNSLRGPG